MVHNAYAQPTPPQHIIKLHDPASGLKATIAIHSTALGPAAGGCRFWSYASEADATQDALRLAEGMTYKNALAGLPFGGGKTVIVKPQGDFDRMALFEAFGRALNELHGAYITAEDVGTTIADMQAVNRHTPYVAGLPAKNGSAGGDPSPWTSLGTFLSIEHMVLRKLGRTLSDVTVAVQGIGSVGFGLCSLLHDAGAKLIVSDPNHDLTQRAHFMFGAQVVPTALISEAQADVLAPCALGGSLNEEMINKIKATIICGAANNQLATEVDGELLQERGILYGPDFVVNAGGIINVACEYLCETTAEVEARVRKIPSRLSEILDAADASGRPTSYVAEQLARQLINNSPADAIKTLQKID